MKRTRLAAAWGATALWLLAAAPAQAQVHPTYKCFFGGGITYTHVPCAGGHEVGARTPRRTERSRPVPQDRATIARRAVLSEEEREECRALDARMLEQQAELKARGDSATLDDEMPLVHSKKRFRELRC